MSKERVTLPLTEDFVCDYAAHAIKVFELDELLHQSQKKVDALQGTLNLLAQDDQRRVALNDRISQERINENRIYVEKLEAVRLCRQKRDQFKLVAASFMEYHAKRGGYTHGFIRGSSALAICVMCNYSEHRDEFKKGKFYISDHCKNLPQEPIESIFKCFDIDFAGPQAAQAFLKMADEHARSPSNQMSRVRITLPLTEDFVCDYAAHAIKVFELDELLHQSQKEVAALQGTLNLLPQDDPRRVALNERISQERINENRIYEERLGAIGLCRQKRDQYKQVVASFMEYHAKRGGYTYGFVRGSSALAVCVMCNNSEHHDKFKEGKFYISDHCTLWSLKPIKSLFKCFDIACAGPPCSEKAVVKVAGEHALPGSR